MKNINIYSNGESTNEFKKYNKDMKKTGIDSSFFDKLNNEISNGLKLTVISNRYEKKALRNFPRKPTETTVEHIDARNYACYMSSIGFFGGRVYNS